MNSIKDIASTMGISTQTVRNWVDRPEFAPYFSDAAKAVKGLNRVFLTEDVRVLHTINQLKIDHKNITWDEIAQQLNDGIRYETSGESAVGASTKRVPYEQAEIAAKASGEVAKAITQRDDAYRQVEALQEEIKTIRSIHDKEIMYYRQKLDDLHDEIRKLNREIGRLEGQIGRSDDDDV